MACKLLHEKGYRRLLNIERHSDSNQGSHYLEFSALPTELPGRTKIMEVFRNDA